MITGTSEGSVKQTLLHLALPLLAGTGWIWVGHLLPVEGRTSGTEKAQVREGLARKRDGFQLACHPSPNLPQPPPQALHSHPAKPETAPAGKHSHFVTPVNSKNLESELAGTDREVEGLKNGGPLSSLIVSTSPSATSG